MQLTPHAQGRFRLRQRNAAGHTIYCGPWQPNTLLYGWATIVAELLSGNQDYRLGAMYVEYENLADPEDEVATPTIFRSDGKTYYDALGDSADRDYLRVPIRFTALSSSDDELFPGGNILTAVATTTGTAGVHGKAFSNGANSKVFGAALVATPEFADETQDQVFNRTYWEGDDQLPKLASGQLDVEVAVEFQ